ncbi:MAG: 2-hydroxyacyl-CoA dehydratase family protein [Clostridiales Family XIII bacterium]|jgi:benzoyl-CoA reductase/2-hydroxyglutaryl-CoA dehydratase subunit BcrC/BadD/HgdB|nr:2-hydroxyacyl-CoA dehydratase family protein [Clostridiales Family XIII bacterium]
MQEFKESMKALQAAALHPGKTVRLSMRETGREAIGCFPIYTPDEIVYAAGYLPVGMWGGKTQIRLADKYLQGFCCSIMRANMEFGLQGTYDFLKAVIIPAFCDTLKCICENWKVAVPQIPAIPMVYPQNRKLETGFRYLIAELKRVKKEIEGIKGAEISEAELEKAFRIYEEYRAVMRDFVKASAVHPLTVSPVARHLIIKAGFFMDKAKYTALVRGIVEGLQALPEEKCRGVKAVATGLIGEPAELPEIFGENGICIAADDFAQESRQFRVKGREEGSVWEKMAYRTVDQEGCTFLFDEEKPKGRMLIRMTEETGAKAVIVCMMKFCDPEEFDFPVIKEELEAARIPILCLEIDQQMDSFEQIRTRVQSFVEMLNEDVI